MKIFKATSTLNSFLASVDLTKNPDEADIVLVGGQQIELSRFPKLIGIFKCGVGTDNLPFEEAKEKGVLIKLPSDKTNEIIFEETANFTCHLILKGLYSEIGTWNNWVKEKRNMLSEKKLLVIGTGRIGGRIASKNEFVYVSYIL